MQREKDLVVAVFRDRHGRRIVTSTQQSRVLAIIGGKKAEGLALEKVVLVTWDTNPFDGSYAVIPRTSSPPARHSAEHLMEHLRRAGEEVGVYSVRDDAPKWPILTSERVENDLGGKGVAVYRVSVATARAFRILKKFLRAQQ